MKIQMDVIIISHCIYQLFYIYLEKLVSCFEYDCFHYKINPNSFLFLLFGTLLQIKFLYHLKFVLLSNTFEILLHHIELSLKEQISLKEELLYNILYSCISF